jgi:hypothetical protein
MDSSEQQVERLFQLVGSEGLAKSNIHVMAKSKTPFSTEVNIDEKEYNVVMQVLEFLERRITVRSLKSGPLETEYCEDGFHLSFEIQQLHPTGSEKMNWNSAFVWLDKRGRFSLEWQSIVQVGSKAV